MIFTRKPRLKPYISRNTKKKLATNNELLNEPNKVHFNTVYEKTVDNYNLINKESLKPLQSADTDQ